MLNITKKTTFKTKVYNNGANQSIIEFEKKTLLFDAIRNHTELVKEKAYYPKDEYQNIELELDFVILSREDYYKLLEGKTVKI